MAQPLSVRAVESPVRPPCTASSASATDPNMRYASPSKRWQYGSKLAAGFDLGAPSRRGHRHIRQLRRDAYDDTRVVVPILLESMKRCEQCPFGHAVSCLLRVRRDSGPECDIGWSST